VRGKRLLSVCRHSRVKGVSRLLRLFAKHIALREPEASLTLVGDGPDHDSFRSEARTLGVAERCFFAGELPAQQLSHHYAHADLFVYPSLSETYGQIVSEALWCGLPVVAFADGMGVSHQLEGKGGGQLISAGPDTEAADQRFARAVLQLLQSPGRRRAMAEAARTQTRKRAHPERVLQRYRGAFELARHHCASTSEARIERPLASVAALGRWAVVQGLVFSAGWIRPPSEFNRGRRRQPTRDGPMPHQVQGLAVVDGGDGGARPSS